MRLNKQRITSSFKSLVCVLLILTMIVGAMPFGIGEDKSYAKNDTSDPVELVFFYAKNSSGKDVLLKTYTLNEFVALEHPDTIYSFSSIDNLPVAVFTEAQGFELPQVVDYVKRDTNVSGAKNIEFTDGGTMVFWSTDNWTTPLKYEEISGYYYPNLYSQWITASGDRSNVIIDKEKAKKDAEPRNVILGTKTYQSRLTDNSLEGYLDQHGRLDGVFKDKIDDDRILRLCIPQQPEYIDSERVVSTTNNNSKWVYRMLLDMGEGKRPNINASEVAKPYYVVTQNKDNSNMVDIEIKCDTEGADIYYSLNSEYSPQKKYTEPITVPRNEQMTFKMHATKVGSSDAGIIEAKYPLETPQVNADNKNNTIGNDIELSYTVNSESGKWLDSISEIQYSESLRYTKLDESKYDTSLKGIIKLDKSLFKEGISEYKIKIISNGYQDVELTQIVLSTPPDVKADTVENYPNSDIVLTFEDNKYWRENVSVYINGTGEGQLVRENDIDKSQAGKIIIKSTANKFTKLGDYTITLKRSGTDMFAPVVITQTIVQKPEPPAPEPPIPPVPPTINVTDISLDKEGVTLLEGESINLLATVTPSNATNKNVNWSSSNPEIATVDSFGKVVAVKKGNVTITATTSDGNKKANCEVTVISEYIEFDRDDSKIIESKEQQLEDKVWTVKFNKDVKYGDYLKSNIFVVDKDNKSQNIDIELGEDLKSIKILPPKEGYKSGESYTIVIKNVESKDDKLINKVTIMDFSIK